MVGLETADDFQTTCNEQIEVMSGEKQSTDGETAPQNMNESQPSGITNAKDMPPVENSAVVQNEQTIHIKTQALGMENIGTVRIPPFIKR